MMVEYFEHTADVGMRIKAAALPELFQEAARGLFGLIVENLDNVGAGQAWSLELSPRPLEYLLFDWLKELLYRFDQGHQIVSRCTVTVVAAGDGAGWGLQADLAGETMDPDRHVMDHEVKAITYHELAVVETASGWEATVIVDI
ncbi:MAG TPA: archease [Gemmatales bacterium]|nr:archease [Gemmatales bacterium]